MARIEHWGTAVYTSSKRSTVHVNESFVSELRAGNDLQLTARGEL